MRRYDLSKIMREAHMFRKNAKCSMSEALRKSWRRAKFFKQINEQLPIIEAERKAEEEAKAKRIREAAMQSIIFNAEQEARRIIHEAEYKVQRMKDEEAARKEGISYDEYQNRLSLAMGYGCGRYCGD